MSGHAFSSTFEWVCPYCDVPNKVRVDHPYTPPKVMYCESEFGGCDQPSVVAATAVITFRVDVLRVEGFSDVSTDPEEGAT